MGYHVNVSFDVGWDRRKLPGAQRQIVQTINQLGGIKHLKVGFEGLESPEPKPSLRLGCRNCGKDNGKPYEGWEAQRFSACPDCGQRDVVYKMPPAPQEHSEASSSVEPADAPAPPAVSAGADHKHEWSRKRNCLFRDCDAKKPGPKT